MFYKLTRKDKQLIREIKRVTGKDAFKCCLCGETFYGFGNNPYPLCPEDDYESRCCNECDSSKVIPARIAIMLKGRK